MSRTRHPRRPRAIKVGPSSLSTSGHRYQNHNQWFQKTVKRDPRVPKPGERRDTPDD